MYKNNNYYSFMRIYNKILICTLKLSIHMRFKICISKVVNKFNSRKYNCLINKLEKKIIFILSNNFTPSS
jgi:hypothetical protein